MKESPNFFDRRTLTAIALVFATWTGWQYYMQKKYPELYQKKDQPAVEHPVPTESKSELPAPQAPVTGVLVEPPKGAAPAAEALLDFHSENWAFQVSSKGMGIRHLKLPEYKNRKGETVEFSSAYPPISFETRLLGAADTLDFKIEKVSETMFVGRARSGGVEITKTIQIDAPRYALQVKIATKGQDSKFVGLSQYLSDEVEPHKASSFLFANQFDHQSAYVHATESKNNHVYFDGSLIEKTWSKGQVVAIGSQYFTQALVDHSPILPDVKLRIDPEKKAAHVELQYSNINRAEPMALVYTAYAGPKSIALLKSVDEELIHLIDFGMFAWLARYILVMLKGFHSLVDNWGVAIILLTIVVRILVLPFNIMSYKSMRAMQELQPQMTALRERYKDDQQKLNQEMMGLLRTNKVNPLGGCLPILLQLPIFLALYQVLGQSIELYQAPFMFWIKDLSLADPFYVLPVLMGITMFVQQKITPNTLDPAQARILMFMPVLFSVFMLGLPSGLTLYIFVSALFAVVQQFYFIKAHGAPARVPSGPIGIKR